MEKTNLDFFELFNRSARFKKMLTFSTLIFTIIVVFIFTGVINNNDKIIALMKDRQKSEFNKTYFYVIEHYKKLAEVFYKELEEHKFIKKFYYAKDKETIDSLLYKINTQTAKDYNFDSFEVELIKNSKNIFDFNVVSSTDGFHIENSVFYNKNYLGNLKIKIKTTHLHRWMESLSGAHTYLIFKKDFIKDNKNKIFEPSFIDENYLHNKILNTHIEEHHVNSNYDISMEDVHFINQKLKKRLKDINFQSDYVVEWVTLKAEETINIAVVLKPLFDSHSKHNGYLVNYVIDKEYTKYKKIYNLSLLLFSIIVLILYIFILFILYQKEIERIKNSKLKTLIKDLKAAKKDVNTKQLELLRINNNLEDKIQESINKQREKDKIMFQQSKLATMGEMIGNIAHQWRQPLNALSLQIQDMKAAYEYNEIDKKYIDQTVDNSMKNIDYMSKTIDDFRKFFEPSKVKISFDIIEHINHALDIISVQLKKLNIKVEIQKEDKTYTSLGYPNEFKQAIINILNNSKDAFAEELEKTKEQKDLIISISLSQQKDFNIIKIEDNAGGIPNDVLDRIFEPYFTTKKEGKGTGLGLYMSKMIIEENISGILEVTNGKKGAIFTLKLKKYKI